MISGLGGIGHVIVANGTNTGLYINAGSPSAGMVRYINNNFEVYDGSSWVGLYGSFPIIDLTSSANSAINWAMKKMSEEAELEKIANESPAIKAAYDNMLRAAEQLKTTIILSKDDKTTS
jgi:hypothetical protein